MSIPAAAIRKMVAIGLSGEEIAELCEIIEAGFAAQLVADLETPVERKKRLAKERTAAWRARREASQSVTERHQTSPNVTETCDAQASPERHQASQNVTGASRPRARVESNLLTEENTGYADAVVDEWPERDVMASLVVRVASHRLDPSKSPGLVTTAGRLAAWKRDGASWAHDVIPVVSGLCSKRGPPVSSWNYFNAAIAQSISSNRQALEIPTHERLDQNRQSFAAADPRRANTESRRSSWARLAEERSSPAGGGGTPDDGEPVRLARLPGRGSEIIDPGDNDGGRHRA